jgi:ABC-type multidrug transport system permease subunit
MANLRSGTGPFFTFLLFGFTCTLVMSMIFRTVGQATRNIYQALLPTSLFVLVLVIYAGFVIPTSNMRSRLRWLNYLNPIGYAFESIIANEFRDREFPCTLFTPAGPSYANTTDLHRVCTVPGAMPGANVIDGDLWIRNNFNYAHSHTWRSVGWQCLFMCRD